MEQAIERVTRSIEGYQTGQIARSIATIELVSAFKSSAEISALMLKT